MNLANCDKAEISATVTLLRYYRDFLASKAKIAYIPGDLFRSTMDKAVARRRLSTMLDEAINRKAGLVRKGRKTDSDYWWNLVRDSQRLRDQRERRIIIHGFDSPECKARLAHLVASRCH